MTKRTIAAMRNIDVCKDCRCFNHTGFGCVRLEHMIESGEIGRTDYELDKCSAHSPACDWARFVGTDFGDSDVLTNVIAAKACWNELHDFPTDGDGCIDEPFFDPYLGMFDSGCDVEYIWYAIEETYGVSVAWLMGEAKNPDGTNDREG